MCSNKQATANETATSSPGSELWRFSAGRPFAQVAAGTERDNYMSAEEALAYGLIDKIIDKR